MGAKYIHVGTPREFGRFRHEEALQALRYLEETVGAEMTIVHESGAYTKIEVTEYGKFSREEDAEPA